jgi:tubulin-folding cofactor B
LGLICFSHTQICSPPILGIKVDARCRLLAASQSESSLERRGTVKFVGPVPEIPGVGAWVGIALDEPTGKNDGTVKGTRYFECGANCGVVVRPGRVEVGDFDVIDEFGSDEEF